MNSTSIQTTNSKSSKSSKKAVTVTLLAAAVSAGLLVEGAWAQIGPAGLPPNPPSRQVRAAVPLVNAAPVSASQHGASASAPAAQRSASLGAQSTPAIASQTIGTPHVAGCSAAACSTGIAVDSKHVATPAIASRHVATPAVNVPATCAARIACFGPFTVPSAWTSTPAIASKQASTPAAKAPAACSAASRACDATLVPAFRVALLPAIAPRGLTPAVSVNLSSSGLSTTTATHAGELGTIGPLDVDVPVPGIGNIAVVLFPDGAPAPKVPTNALNGSVTLTLKVGDRSFTTTVPVSH